MVWGLSPYSLEQRFEFIKDCYKSGLSSPVWCHDNNISPGTFYGWIKQVTSHGYEIPDSLNYHPAVKDADKPSVLSAHIEGITLDIPQILTKISLQKLLNLSRSAYDW